MTLVYARISDTTVAEQYFTRHPSRRDRGTVATARSRCDDDATGAPVGFHRRLLGNAHCTRPLELDCRFQTICEGCGFYETGPESSPSFAADATTPPPTPTPAPASTTS